MIVWAGIGYPGDFHTGGRYNFDTDSWTATSTTHAPSPRQQHTAVWTGSEMIVWGGINRRGILNSGGKYCVQSQAPMARSAFSRKIDGSGGTFDISLPLAGNVGIERRGGGLPMMTCRAPKAARRIGLIGL
jgi:hypothetical protein